MRSSIGSLLTVCAALLLFSTTAVRADDAPVPPRVGADSCAASPGAITATADGKPLNAGAGVVIRDSASPTLTITVPGTFGVVAQPGDKASFMATPDGNTQITWTLANGASPYRYLNLTSAGTVSRVITALHLRGLTPCVQSTGGADELDLKLPHNLGTARFTASASDWSSIAVNAGSATDTLVLTGTLRPMDLAHSRLTLSSRFNGALTALGAVAFTANGLESGALALPAAIDVGTPAGSLKIARLSLQLVPGGGSRVTAGFVPPLPAALPFTLKPVDVELLADPRGAVSTRCAGNAEATASAPIIGTPPNLTLALGGPESPITLSCEGGRFTKLSGTVAVTWPSTAAAGTTTAFTFVAGEGPLRFTPVDGALPSLRFEALGLDANVTNPSLSSTDSDLFVSGQVTLALRFAPGFPTAQGGLRIAIRAPAAGGQPSFALQCGTPPASVKTNGAIALQPDCDGGEIDGVKSDGGTFTLPDAVGAGSIAVRAFRIVRGKLDSPADVTCVPPAGTAASPQPFLKFGSLTLDSCTFGYDGSTGLKLAVGGHVALPGYLIANGTTLNVANVVIAYRPASRRYGVVSLDANLTPAKDQPLHLFGMDVDAFTDTRATATACKDGAVLRVRSDDAGVGDTLRLTLCAQARLPEYLSFESKPRVGLLKDGVIQARATRPPVLFFRGLDFGPDGIEKPADAQLSATTDCESPTGLAGHEDAPMLYDCRAWGSYDPKVTIGPLALSNIKLRLVARALDARDQVQLVPGNAPQFHFSSDVAFAKYMSSDGPDGQLTADFDHKHMVMLGEFPRPVTVHAGVATLGLQGFEMDLDATQRKFVASGASIAGESTGVNSTALYFKSITFLETNEGSGWHLKKLSAPVDAPKTLIGFAYRLFSDLGASSFLHWFRLR